MLNTLFLNITEVSKIFKNISSTGMNIKAIYIENFLYFKIQIEAIYKTISTLNEIDASKIVYDRV